MDNTYRHIFKWGDKREEKIDSKTLKVIQDRFGLDSRDLTNNHLTGNDPVEFVKTSGIKENHLEYLKSITGEDNILTDDFSRVKYSFGKFYGELLSLRTKNVPQCAGAVVAPRSNAEIIAIVDYCNRQNIPIVPVGGQSSVTGALQLPLGGIALDLTKHINEIVEINKANKTVTIQCGIYGPALEALLNREGYTCGHYPQSFEYSTVGGWIAAKGAGQASTGYGKIEDIVVSVKAVTPAGVIETKDFPRTAQAWDIYRIFIGSEGTLGVITEATLKVFDFKPNNSRYASFIFRSFEEGVAAMREMVQSEYGKPHLFRISDPEETDIAFKTRGFENSAADKILKLLGYFPGKRCLMLAGVEGDGDYTRFVVRKLRKSARKHNGFSSGAGAVKRWLEHRYSSAYLRDPLMDMGIMTDTLETAVTWDNILEVWSAVRQYSDSRPSTVMMIHISHVYENGANLYFTFLSPMEKGNERGDFDKFHSGLVNTIISNGGSLSHHHGVGRVLAPWMSEHLGHESMALLQAVKDHLDPNNIMNPGNTLGLK